MEPGELLRACKEKADMSRKTFYRALDALKESGVVVTQVGKHYWYEFVDARVFGSEYEAKQALHHSSNIATGLKHLLGSQGTYSTWGEQAPNPKYVRHALMHLKTGYREIFEVFEKSEKIKEQIHEEELKLKRELEAKLLSSSIKTSYPEHIVDIVLSDLKETLRGRKTFFLDDLRIQNRQVKSGAYTSLLDAKEADMNKMFESLKHFIATEESARENRKSCMEVVELESKYYNLRKAFDREIENLIMLVENGNSLKGRCQICPKDKIISSDVDTKADKDG